MIRLQEIDRVFRVGEEDVHALDRVTIDIGEGESALQFTIRKDTGE